MTSTNEKSGLFQGKPDAGRVSRDTWFVARRLGLENWRERDFKDFAGLQGTCTRWRLGGSCGASESRGSGRNGTESHATAFASASWVCSDDSGGTGPGHSVEVLLTIYAKRIDGHDQAWFAGISRALGEATSLDVVYKNAASRPPLSRNFLYRQSSLTSDILSHIILAISLQAGPFAGEMIRGAQDAAWRQGYLLMIVETGHDRQLVREAVTRFAERRIRRIILRPVLPPAGRPTAGIGATPTRSWPTASIRMGRFASFVPDEYGGALLPCKRCWPSGGNRSASSTSRGPT